MPSAIAQGEAPSEYDIKAGFLFNFLRYIDLPPRPGSGATLTLGILGSDPSGGSFDIINGKTMRGKTLVVKHLGAHADPRVADILFVCNSEMPRLREVFERLGHAGVLTVGDSKAFAQRGGMINFIMENNKVRFQINPDAANRANVKISSQLLRLAKVVHG